MKHFYVFILTIVMFVHTTFADPGDFGFWRGDANGDLSVNQADPIFIGNYLFNQGPPPPHGNLDAMDANDDEAIDISDQIYLLTYLWMSGPQPPDPFGWLGTDETPTGTGPGVQTDQDTDMDDDGESLPEFDATNMALAPMWFGDEELPSLSYRWDDYYHIPISSTPTRAIEYGCELKGKNSGLPNTNYYDLAIWEQDYVWFQEGNPIPTKYAPSFWPGDLCPSVRCIKGIDRLVSSAHTGGSFVIIPKAKADFYAQVSNHLLANKSLMEVLWVGCPDDFDGTGGNAYWVVQFAAFYPDAGGVNGWTRINETVRITHDEYGPFSGLSNSVGDSGFWLMYHVYSHTHLREVNYLDFQDTDLFDNSPYTLDRMWGTNLNADVETRSGAGVFPESSSPSAPCDSTPWRDLLRIRVDFKDIKSALPSTWLDGYRVAIEKIELYNVGVGRALYEWNGSKYIGLWSATNADLQLVNQQVKLTWTIGNVSIEYNTFSL